VESSVEFCRIIPSMLYRGDRLVKGVGFGGHRDAGNPITTTRVYDSQGADELLVLRIEPGSKPDDGKYLEQMKTLARECSIPLCLGGGIEALDDAQKLFDCGADKVFVSRAARTNPALITQIARRFGNQAVMVGLEIVRTNGRTLLYDSRATAVIPDIGWLDHASRVVEAGAVELRLCSVGHEGTGKGLDLEAFGTLAGHVNVPIILEGGCKALEHLDVALHAGCRNIALGSMLVFSDHNIIKIKAYLKNKGHRIRV